MDIGTISLILMVSLITLLAIGMPLGLASAALAVLVLVMKFEPTLLLTDPLELWRWAADGQTIWHRARLISWPRRYTGFLTDYVLDIGSTFHFYGFAT